MTVDPNNQPVFVVGFLDGKKIHAVKEIRAATGFSLKDAKDVVDAVEAGRRVEIHTKPDVAWEYVEVEDVPSQVTLSDFMNVLQRFPRDRTVGEIVDVLKAARSEFAPIDAASKKAR